MLSIRKHGGSDIDTSNPYGNQTTNFISQTRKQPSLQDFLNQNENIGKFSSKSKSPN